MTYTESTIQAERDRYKDRTGRSCTPEQAALALEAQANMQHPAHVSEDERKANAERQRRWRERNPNSASRISRNQYLRAKYGITLDKYEAGVEQREGLCDLCGQKPAKTHNHGRLVVDHCHDTGIVRGLLCQPCNTGIGSLGDNVERITKALAYVTDPPGVEFLK